MTDTSNILRLLYVVSSLLCAIPTNAQDIGWLLEEKKDALDGSINYIASVKGENWDLVIRCDDNYLFVIFARIGPWHSSEGFTSLKYRFDSNDIENLRLIQRGGTIGAYFTPAYLDENYEYSAEKTEQTAQKFVRDIIESERLSIDIEGFQDSFDTSSSDQYLGGIIQSCMEPD